MSRLVPVWLETCWHIQMFHFLLHLKQQNTDFMMMTMVPFRLPSSSHQLIVSVETSYKTFCWHVDTLTVCRKVLSQHIIQQTGLKKSTMSVQHWEESAGLIWTWSSLLSANTVRRCHNVSWCPVEPLLSAPVSGNSNVFSSTISKAQRLDCRQITWASFGRSPELGRVQFLSHTLCYIKYSRGNTMLYLQGNMKN